MNVKNYVGKTVTVDNRHTFTVMYASVSGKILNPKSKWYGKQPIQLSGKDAMGITVRVKTDSPRNIIVH